MSKILLIDNDETRVEPLRRALEEVRFEVEVAASASFALTMLEWNRPALVVSREDIPDMDGYELCALIRSDTKTRDIPFVLLVGPGAPVPGAAAHAGVDWVLAGQVIPSDVVARVRRVLNRPKKVLVVDDSVAVRKTLALALETRRLTVLSAGLVGEALALLTRHRPDLVVCDVHLPDGDGYQVCELAKTQAGVRTVPVILMSGAAEEATPRPGRLPPDELLRKPFLPDELASRIEQLLLAVPAARA